MELNGIEVTYESTKDIKTATGWLNNLPNTFACDFEVATKYTPEERQAMQDELEQNIPKRRRIELQQTLRATALDHPYHCTITHLSIGISDNQAYVFILDNPEITNLVLEFLVTTEKKQVWHNASYDFKHIYFNTKRFPIVYEDTQILAKTLINNVDVMQSKTGLKQIAGEQYGAWGISSDNFDLEHMYDEHVLQYAAIDAAATYWIWDRLQPRFEDGNN